MEDLNIINHNIKFTINVNYLENTFQCNEDNEIGKFNIVDKSLILIWENKDIEYYELSDLDDKTYIQNNTDINDKSDNNIKDKNNNIKDKNKKINIIHNEWEDIIYLIDDNRLCRNYNNEETATYELTDDCKKLTIYWDKWGVEYFYKDLKPNSYKLSQKNVDEIKDEPKNINIFHISWTDNCFINGDRITRSSILDDSGSIVIKNDTLIIHWDKWESEKFILFNDNKDAYYETMIKSYEYSNMKIFLNLVNNKIYNTFRNQIIGYFCIDKNIIHAIFIKNDNMNNIYQEFIYENNNISILNKKYTFITDDRIYYLYNNTLKKYFVDDNDQIYYYLEDIDNQNNHKFYLLLNSKMNEFHIFDEDKMIYINKRVEKNIFNPYLYSRFNSELNNLNHNELILHWLKNSDNKKNIYSIETFLKNNDFFHLNNFKTLNNLFFTDEDVIIYWFKKYKYKNYFYTSIKIDIIYKSLAINNCDILYTIINNIDDVHTIQNLLYKKPIIIVFFISIDNKDLTNICTDAEKKNDNTIIIKYQDKNEYLFSNKISEIIETYSLNINKVFYVRDIDKLCEEALLNSIYTNKSDIIIKDDIEYEIKIKRINNILLEMLYFSDNYYDSIKILIIYTIYIRKIFSKFEDMVIMKIELFNEMIDFFNNEILSIQI
jgi:hypothetical protein